MKEDEYSNMQQESLEVLRVVETSTSLATLSPLPAALGLDEHGTASSVASASSSVAPQQQLASPLQVNDSSTAPRLTESERDLLSQLKRIGVTVAEEHIRQQMGEARTTQFVANTIDQSNLLRRQALLKENSKNNLLRVGLFAGSIYGGASLSYIASIAIAPIVTMICIASATVLFSIALGLVCYALYSGCCGSSHNAENNQNYRQQRNLPRHSAH